MKSKSSPKRTLANRENGKKGGRPRIPIETPDLKQIGLEGKLPPKPIDLDVILHWMDLGATAAEIAGSFRIGVTTLDEKLKELTGLGFRELKKKVCGFAKISLRRNQFNLTKTNAAMGIWLGKQWLGQKDNPHHDQGFDGELKEFMEYLRQKYKKDGKDEPAEEGPDCEHGDEEQA